MGSEVHRGYLLFLCSVMLVLEGLDYLVLYF